MVQYGHNEKMSKTSIAYLFTNTTAAKRLIIYQIA